MGNGECQAETRVFIDSAATVFAAHSTNGSKTCESGDTSWL